MTIVTATGGQTGKSHYNENPSLLDSQSTCEMIMSDHSSDRLTTPKLLAITLIAITCLMGFFMLTAIYIQTNNKCVCSYQSSALASESQNSPYFEPLKALSNDEVSNEVRNLPIRIRMHGNARNMMNPDSNGGRVSCEITRKTASQIVASEPKELNTPFGNITTDPKLMHLTGEKLYFTCYNGEKPKPVVLVARPKIYAIFHRPSGFDSSNNSSETDESNSSDNSAGSDEKMFNNKSLSIDESNNSTNDSSTSLTNEDNNSNISRNKREVSSSNTMDCVCKCPAN